MILLLLLALATAQSPARPDLDGQWQHVDVRGIESDGSGTCLRLWLEERRYGLQPLADRRFGGAYQNVIRAVPVGAASFSRDCRFPVLTANPNATQVRMWSVVAAPIDAQRWRLRAQAGPDGGDVSMAPADDFTTQLSFAHERLVDGTAPSDHVGRHLVFRRPSPAPAEARAALEAAVARLQAGGCLEVTAALAMRTDGVADACALRQQRDALLGPFTAMAVTNETEFDRIASAFLSPGAPGFTRRHGVFYEFTATFARARVPGGALVVEEDGRWRLAVLWF